jgi:hypothetical protein
MLEDFADAINGNAAETVSDAAGAVGFFAVFVALLYLLPA